MNSSKFDLYFDYFQVDCMSTPKFNLFVKSKFENGQQIISIYCTFIWTFFSSNLMKL